MGSELFSDSSGTFGVIVKGSIHSAIIKSVSGMISEELHKPINEHYQRSHLYFHLLEILR